jgi:hypothetical protein
VLERTTIVSPTLRPLRIWVVESPTTPVCTCRVDSLPSSSCTVTAEPLSAWEGIAMPDTCEVTMSAVALMPALRCLLVWSSVSVTG